MDRATQVRGVLLAGALGDAWGNPYEGRPGPIAAEFPEHPRLSDDTLLTVATCEAIVAAGGVIAPHVIADRFREWFEAGRLRGLGSATLKALRDLAAGAHWALAGARGEYAAGSGAAMRIAPLAFFLDPSQPDHRVIIRDVSRITHHSEEAYVGALGVVAAIRVCLETCSVPPDLLAIVAAQLPDTAVRDRLLALHQSSREPEEVVAGRGSSGYVVDVVPLALCVAMRAGHNGLEHALRRAISLGGDTDTIASIVGQVVGAMGHAPPESLLQRIPDFGAVRTAVDALAAVAVYTRD